MASCGPGHDPECRSTSPRPATSPRDSRRRRAADPLAADVTRGRRLLGSRRPRKVQHSLAPPADSQQRGGGGQRAGCDGRDRRREQRRDRHGRTRRRQGHAQAQAPGHRPAVPVLHRRAMRRPRPRWPIPRPRTGTASPTLRGRLPPGRMGRYLRAKRRNNANRWTPAESTHPAKCVRAFDQIGAEWRKQPAASAHCSRGQKKRPRARRDSRERSVPAWRTANPGPADARAPFQRCMPAGQNPQTPGRNRHWSTPGCAAPMMGRRRRQRRAPAAQQNKQLCMFQAPSLSSIVLVMRSAQALRRVRTATRSPTSNYSEVDKSGLTRQGHRLRCHRRHCAGRSPGTLRTPSIGYGRRRPCRSMTQQTARPTTPGASRRRRPQLACLSSRIWKVPRWPAVRANKLPCISSPCWASSSAWAAVINMVALGSSRPRSVEPQISLARPIPRTIMPAQSVSLPARGPATSRVQASRGRRRRESSRPRLALLPPVPPEDRAVAPVQARQQERPNQSRAPAPTPSIPQLWRPHTESIVAADQSWRALNGWLTSTSPLLTRLSEQPYGGQFPRSTPGGPKLRRARIGTDA